MSVVRCERRVPQLIISYHLEKLVSCGRMGLECAGKKHRDYMCACVGREVVMHTVEDLCVGVSY